MLARGTGAVAVFLLLIAAAHFASGSKSKYFDDFLFDSLNAKNMVLKPRAKAAVSFWNDRNVGEETGSGPARTAPQTPTAKTALRRNENATSTAATATTLRPRTGGQRSKGPARVTPLPSPTAVAVGGRLNPTTAAAVTAAGWNRFVATRNTAQPGRQWKPTEASDEDVDDDDSDEDVEKDEDSGLESSGDRSDQDDERSDEASRGRRVHRKHSKRQSAIGATRARPSSSIGSSSSSIGSISGSSSGSSVASDLNRMSGVPREHWSCCMLGKLAGDKGFDCHAQFYSRRLLDRNANRAHNRRLTDTYFANGESTPAAVQLMSLFSSCVRTQAAEFHDCCREALDETVARRERWSRFEQVVAEVRVARQ